MEKRKQEFSQSKSKKVKFEEGINDGINDGINEDEQDLEG